MFQEQDSFALTESQRRRLLEYIEERRGIVLQRVICSAVILLVTSPMLLGMLQAMLLGFSFGIQVTAFAMLYGGAFAGFLVNGYRKRLIGPESDLNMMRQNRFMLVPVRIAGKKPNVRGTPPFILLDEFGTEYQCPMYLDYRDVQIGTCMTGIIFSGGGRYVMQNTVQAQLAMRQRPMLPSPAELAETEEMEMPSLIDDRNMLVPEDED